jgi:hypothetical protein
LDEASYNPKIPTDITSCFNVNLQVIRACDIAKLLITAHLMNWEAFHTPCQQASSSKVIVVQLRL